MTIDEIQVLHKQGPHPVRMVKEYDKDGIPLYRIMFDHSPRSAGLVATFEGRRVPICKGLSETPSGRANAEAYVWFVNEWPTIHAEITRLREEVERLEKQNRGLCEREEMHIQEALDIQATDDALAEAAERIVGARHGPARVKEFAALQAALTAYQKGGDDG